MATDWLTATVGDVAVRVTKGTTPTTIGGRFVDHGINFVKVESITADGRLDAEKLAHIDAATNDMLARSVLCADDVLFTIAGTIGRVALVPSSALPANTNQAVAIVRPDQNAVDPRFLYYVLRDRSRLQQANTRVVQSVQSNFSLAELRALEIPLPDIAQQRAIAHILGTLDDKIELNRRMNETLEATARALFKSWFVGFDPVRAKSEGRDPGLPPRVADLFSDSFADSEPGEIPRGWRPSTIGNEVATVLGGTPSRSVPSYWAGDIPWINSGTANEFRITEPSEYITREGLASSATKMLPSRTTAIAITGATLGQVSLTEIETCANQSVVGVLGTSSLPSEFLYFWVKEHIHELLAAETGGAQQHINKNDVNDLRVVCPSQPVIAAYLALVRPAFDRIRSGCMEVRTLAELRDRLLRELISGQVRTADPERSSGRAVS